MGPRRTRPLAPAVNVPEVRQGKYSGTNRNQTTYKPGHTFLSKLLSRDSYFILDL